jgi:hypothetical protein
MGNAQAHAFEIHTLNKIKTITTYAQLGYKGKNELQWLKRQRTNFI